MPNALLALLLAAPAAALVTGSHTWRVPSERIASGEPIESEPFSCAGQTWSLKLSPRGPRRCGVELRYAANDVGDAVDAAFTLSVGASSEEGGLTFVHPLAAGVLDGEATTYETELELEDDVIEVNSEIQVYAEMTGFPLMELDKAEVQTFPMHGYGDMRAKSKRMGQNFDANKRMLLCDFNHGFRDTGDSDFVL